MNEMLQELLQFHSQRYHVPIELATEQWVLDNWMHESVLVALPPATEATKVIEGMTFSHSPKFGKELGGDLIVVHDLTMARVGTDFLDLLFLPTNQPAWNLVRTLVDQHIPKLCRAHRRRIRENMVECLSSCVEDRKKELQDSVRDDGYELERNSMELMTLARKLETDRQILRMFEKSPERIKAHAMRTFVDLMKLVPATYANIWIENDVVQGVTHPIAIEYDGGSYKFDPFTVKVDVRKGTVLITGGTKTNGFIHPHVKDEESNICWGNIGHLVSRLTGELDLFGLFQLVHQFLTTYNENDPFLKIQHWDPDWTGEDEDNEPFCSWCDDFGHDISHCESCWWCEYCSQYDEHDLEDCPNRPKDEEEEEVVDAIAEEA